MIFIIRGKKKDPIFFPDAKIYLHDNMDLVLIYISPILLYLRKIKEEMGTKNTNIYGDSTVNLPRCRCYRRMRSDYWFFISTRHLDRLNVFPFQNKFQFITVKWWAIKILKKEGKPISGIGCIQSTSSMAARLARSGAGERTVLIFKERTVIQVAFHRFIAMTSIKLFF